MAVQPNVGGNEKKRKNPPTFRHLPRNTAQKLKKSWVEKKKLKGQWKAQKRREGLDSGWPKLKNSSDPSEKPDDAAVSPNDEDETQQNSVQSEGESSEPEPVPKKPRISELQHDEQHQSLSVKTKDKQSVRLTSKTSGNRKVTDEDAQHEDVDTQPSLRDLTRRAYSRASLHTYKSDPLHRRKEAVNIPSKQPHSSKAGRNNVRERHGSALGRCGSTGRNARGGQPNMKLRMEAMLERIKKNYS